MKSVLGYFFGGQDISLPVLMAIFPTGPTRMSRLWILLELRMMDLRLRGGDDWNYKTYKAPVKSSPPTSQHPAFYRPVKVLKG